MSGSSEQTLASVSDIRPTEVVLPNAASYQEFHEVYGLAYDERTDTVLRLGRVVINNETSDSQTHVVVRERRNAWYSQPARYCNADESYFQMPYRGEDFLVVTFNGLKTQWWDAASAEGRHYTRHNVIGQYRPDEEIIHLELQDQGSLQRSRLRFNGVSGVGVMDMEQGVLGSILNEERTAEELARIHESIRAVGTVAIAS